MFRLETIKEIDKKTFRLQFSSLSTMLCFTLYALRKSLTDPVGTTYVFSENLGVFAIGLGHGRYRVSALTDSLINIEFEAHDSRIGLHDAPKQERAKYTRKPRVGSKTKKRERHIEILAPTSISLAFEKAKTRSK